MGHVQDLEALLLIITPGQQALIEIFQGKTETYTNGSFISVFIT